MNNYIKPSANVIEIAVKERLSRVSERKGRTYNIRIGQNTYANKTIDTNVYTANSVSKIDWRNGTSES